MLISSLRTAFHTPWIRAAAILFSTIVGAGVLGIPYVIARLGLVVGTFYIIGMGIALAALHIVIAEIVIRTRRHLQLTGLVRKYAGPWAAWIMGFVFFALHVGAMVAYLIGEGESLSALVGGHPIAWTLAFFIVGTFIIGHGIKSITRFDLIMSVATVVVLFIIAIVGLYSAKVLPLSPEVGVSFLLPYGVLLFAFHGTSAIPEVEMVTGTDIAALRKAVLWGSLVPIVLYAVFAIAVVVVTGRGTSDIATIGLGRAIGPWMVVIGNLFAVIAMSSSFVTIGQALRRTLQWDYGTTPAVALTVAVGLPLVIFMLGAREFVKVIGFAGALFGTIEIILILWAYRRMRAAESYEEHRHSGWRFWRG